MTLALAGCARSADEPAKAQQKKTEPTGGQVQANGITIAYESFSPADRETVLLIMGTGGQLTMWPVELCEELVKRGYRVIIYDNRDVGLSTRFGAAGEPDFAAVVSAAGAGKPAPLAYTLYDMAKDAAGLLDSLGIEKAHIVKADKDTEAGVLPDEKFLSALGAFYEEAVKAGVILAGEGLQPSSKGARVRYSGSKRTVIDGPFAETKNLIAGYAIIQFASKAEAIEWTKRFVQVDAPGRLGAESECEIRRIFEAEDFGAEFRLELREQEARLLADAEKRKGK